MALVREPEKPETEQFQCLVSTSVYRRWQELVHRARLRRINLDKAFAHHFEAWLTRVEEELDDITLGRARPDDQTQEVICKWH